MLLAPVSPKRSPSLSDRVAKPPKGLPQGDALSTAFQRELETLSDHQRMFYADGRRALLIVLQGRDTSGKDSTIRKVFGACNPQGCHVTSFRAPSEHELAHDYLWRVHQAVPAKGMIGIFNRSHYEDVLIARVKHLARGVRWKDRFRQINDFEHHLAENGVVILKFFLHISKDEQRQQLLERLTDPKKNWKFRAGDLDDRALWPDYTLAYREALMHCSTPWAPWYIVPSDHRPTRNYLIARLVNTALDALDLRYPRVSADVKALRKALER